MLREIAEQFQQIGPLIRIVIIAAEGSTPREEGVAMTVSAEAANGTIGGGALEYDAIAHARAMLKRDANDVWLRDVKSYPLGPQLGQCCGGHVRLLFERYGETELSHITELLDDNLLHVARPITAGAPMTAQRQRDSANELELHEDAEWFIEAVKPNLLPIFLYGAGHVGREVVRVFEGMAVEITWIDTDESRYPDITPENARRLIAAAPQEAVAYAPDDAFHIVMSYSHPLDLEICHAVLKRGRFRYLGLIGSVTKKQRFLKRLRELGVQEDALSRLICPIGAGGPASKEPAVIAISLAAEILRLAEVSTDDRNRAEQ